ncbi:MAG: serine/threonine protein kinase [Rubrivivax sp.]|nr:serine/threonine protein kinase [Rubrivivax sp.]
MNLSPDDLSTLSRLLDEALDLAPAARLAWLDALPAAQQPLAATLRQMLADADGLAASEHLASLPRLPPQDESVARADERVGPYRLLREIGRGGMGSVWLAERADGSYQRQVALKLPRLAWGAGLGERMARERDIGALLEHAHIARLYDAGVDSLGRPYLALEYVEGQPIDVWCEAQGLSLSQRLTLFVQVVRAVAYAHGRLVVHRDIKPSNVLVTADGQAHLLDFGIAKLLHEAGGTPELTRDDARVLTPYYASPEQVCGEAITVASDVYSLGVLLYVLLTAGLPHAPRRPGLAALEESILEVEPAPVSSRVADKTRARALRGDLDAIVAKALKRLPGQRYATADALADDIERHLAGERVLAQPDLLGYRISKVVRRHRLGFASLAAVAVAVVGGAAAAMVQARNASDAAERARVVKEFVVDVFKVNERGNPINNELRQLPVEVLLERGAKLIETRFAGQTALQAELYGVVSRIMLDMGAGQQAVAYAARHNEALNAAGAEPLARAEAALLMAEALRANHRYADAEARTRLALTLSDNTAAVQMRARLLLVELMLDARRLEAIGPELDQVDALLASVAQAPKLLQARATFLRARMLADGNRFDEANPLFQRAIDTAIVAEGPLSRLASRIRRSFASELMARGHAAWAREMSEGSLAAMRMSGGDDDLEAAIAEAEDALLFAACRCDPDAYQRAMAAIAKGLATIDRLGAKAPASVRARLEGIQGCVATHAGRVEEGYALLSRSTALLRSAFPETRANDCLGTAAMETGRHDEAEREAQALKADAAHQAAGAWRFAQPDVLLASNRLMAGQLAAARQALDEARGVAPLQGALFDHAFWHTTARKMAYAAIDIESADPGAALRRLEGLGDWKSPVGDSWLIRGFALCNLDQTDEGLPFMLQGLVWLEARKPYENNPELAFWRARAGLCAATVGDVAKAQALARLAQAGLAAQPGVSPYYKSPLLALQQRLKGQPRS